ncbi:MAG: phosphatase PAP2 family protein [bacterium]|nr:phosphatase PAP2 family protein [bacterium]
MNKYFLGTAVVSYLVGFEWLSRMSSEILESYLIAGPPKVIVNKVSGRPRPIEGYNSNHWDLFEPGQSFFSGHSSHAFQIARIMDEHIHFVPIDVLLYLGAASVAIQRVDSRWHWASDVWVGGAYGFAVADALAGRHRMKWMTVRPFSGRQDGASGLWLSFLL